MGFQVNFRVDNYLACLNECESEYQIGKEIMIIGGVY